MNTTCPQGADFTTCTLCASDAKAEGGQALRDWYDARAAVECAKKFPRRYRDARADHPDVLTWATDFHKDPAACRSLLISGPVGTGKTFQAYGAIRAALACGRVVKWEAVPFADFTAALRPSGRDPEGSLARYRDAALLLVDDLGAAKSSEWVEETTYRLINARYEAMQPTIFTTNIPLKQLRDGLGDRIASRLVETCKVIALIGNDRRRAAA